jgi:hypothetical protein
VRIALPDLIAFYIAYRARAADAARRAAGSAPQETPHRIKVDCDESGPVEGSAEDRVADSF